MIDFPDPPPIQHALLERPTNLCVLLGLLTFFLLLAAMRTRNQKLLIATVATFASALLLLATAALVTTTREHLIHRTRQLVDAATHNRTNALPDLLDPDATLIGPSGDTWLDRQDISAALQRLDRQNVILSQHPVSIRAHTPSDGHARTLLNLRTTAKTDLGEHPIKTAWLITWSHDTDTNRWAAKQIQWLPHPAPDGIKPSPSLLNTHPYH